MKLVKQYPYISFLIIFSIVLALIGIYVALLKLIYHAVRYERHETITDEKGRTIKAVPMEDIPNNSTAYQSSVIKRVGTAKSFYESQTNTTTSQIDCLPYRKIGSGEFSMVAYFEEHGREVTIPQIISLRMILMSKKRFIF